MRKALALVDGGYATSDLKQALKILRGAVS
jgi:hypothetical protein